MGLITPTSIAFQVTFLSPVSLFQGLPTIMERKRRTWAKYLHIYTTHHQVANKHKNLDVSSKFTFSLKYEIYIK